MKLNCKLLFLFFSTVFLYSCQSVPKNLTYFQDLDSLNQKEVTSFDYINYEPKIKVSDVLLITVSSPNPNQELVAQFNLPTTSYLSPGEKVSVQSTTMQTYIVDKDGKVNYPVIGKVKLGGLALSSAVDTLTERVAQYVDDPIINLNILSFKVSVLGEVAKPGAITVSNSRISVLDAIGSAGDLTIYGNRKNVKLIRDNNGKQEIIYFDLTSSKLFSSPYFYLQQNDIIVVDPNNTRKRESNYGLAENYKLSVFATILSTVTVITSVLVAILK